jgi:hypothetical protein
MRVRPLSEEERLSVPSGAINQPSGKREEGGGKIRVG